MRLRSMNYPVGNERGFTLVEALVVVSILAILSAVAIPSYTNHINRSKQTDAAASLMTARLEMEEFFADNGHYAATIQCLPSFVATGNTACLSDCGACVGATAKPRYYTLSIASTGANYQISATRKIYTWAATDVVTITGSSDSPTVANTNALKFSIFEWLFN